MSGWHDVGLDVDVWDDQADDDRADSLADLRAELAAERDDTPGDDFDWDAWAASFEGGE